jgi:hypothetical protein
LFEYVLHPLADLYVLRLSQGTYIFRFVFVLIKTLVPKVGGVVALTVTEYNPLHSANALLPIPLTDEGISISLKPSQL